MQVSMQTRMLTMAMLFIALCESAAQADGVADFYRSRPVSVIVGFEAGSGNDLLTRMVAKYMRDRIPGKPTIVVQNMPGAGSLKAAKFLNDVAPRDGTTFGFIGRGVLLTPLLEPSNASFDVHKLNWLGSASNAVLLGVSWHSSPVKTLADAVRSELVVGSPTATSEGTRMPLLYNAVLGTRFKVVTGYPETQLALAMERGEIAGQIGLSYDSLLTTNRDWIAKKKVNLLLQSGLQKDPRLPNVPLALDGAKSLADRQLMEFLFSIYEIARPFVAPPGLPVERVSVLRDAFMGAVHDPQFLAEAARSNIEILDPVGSDKMRIVLEKAYATPPAIVERAREVIATKP